MDLKPESTLTKWNNDQNSLDSLVCCLSWDTRAALFECSTHWGLRSGLDDQLKYKIRSNMLSAIPTSRLQSYKFCSGFSLPSSLEDRLQRDSLELQDLYLKCLRRAVQSPEVGAAWNNMKHMKRQVICMIVCELEEQRFKCDCKLCHSLSETKVL